MKELPDQRDSSLWHGIVLKLVNSHLSTQVLGVQPVIAPLPHLSIGLCHLSSCPCPALLCHPPSCTHSESTGAGVLAPHPKWPQENSSLDVGETAALPLETALTFLAVDGCREQVTLNLLVLLERTLYLGPCHELVDLSGDLPKFLKSQKTPWADHSFVTLSLKSFISMGESGSGLSLQLTPA